MRSIFTKAGLLLSLWLPAFSAFADNTPHNLAGGNFSQDWSTIANLATADNWSGVPSVLGCRGDGLTAANDVDAQTVTASNTPCVIDVNVNQTAGTFATGGVSEFHLVNPVVGLAGSGTADAPYLLLHLDTTGRTTIVVSYNLRDLDGSTDNAAQQIAILYRVGNAGAFTNIPTGYVADATTGPSLATLVTPVSVTLPAAADNQPLVQIRIITTNAGGNDEYVGVDDVSVTSLPIAPPTPDLDINDVTQVETNAGTTTFAFNVTLSAPAPPGGVTFDIATADNTATTADNDYVTNSLTGQTIPAGSSGPYAFNVTVNGDVTIESTETFFVNVTNIVGANAGDTQGTGTITNDDSATLNIDDVTLVEGPGGTTTFAFTVSLTQPAEPGGVTFDIATADNTATTADSDYVVNSLTGQTIAAGNSTYTFNVTVNGDNNVEPTEAFFVNVTNITGASAGDVQGTGTIVTDEPLLSVDNVTQAETNAGTTTFAFTVSLDIPAPPSGVTFDIATSPGTAVAGTDYVHQALTGQTITAGNTTYTFNVTVNGDSLFEGNDTFFVDVTNVSPGTGISDGQGLGTITNDDTAPTLTIADVALTEGNAGTQTMTFTVTLTGTAEGPVGVDIATADSSATVADLDYVSNSTTLTFAPADTTKTFDVTINGDANAEGDEQFFVNLSGATGGAAISDNQALGIIKLDDPFGISAVDTPFAENFNVLALTTAATTPVGWTLVETAGSGANFTYAADAGSSTTGNTFSYGSVASPDRAFGTLQSGSNTNPTIGAFYRNDTGATVTTLSIQYVGEEWRVGGAGGVDRIDFQYSTDATSLVTGTWINVDELDFSTPDSTTGGSKDGNAAGFRTPRVFTIGSLSLAPSATFWIRWTDFNTSGSDDGLAVDDFSIIANYSGAFLNIDDVTQVETNGATTFTFTVSLTQPAPPGGVTFDIATQDGTATIADNDYAALSLTGQTITAGNTSAQFNVTVNGDVTPEASEEFFVNVTNLTNALPADTQGVGTIVDDDTPITLIHAIQGSGASSSMVGNSVKIEGIVTGVKSNGFFVQEEDADANAEGNPATSEGIFVFTSSTPPLAAAFQARVQVTGTVAEFVPSGDPQQPPVTELTSPGVVQLATAQPLPAAIPLTPTFPDPAGPFDQLERVEHMRVSAASITASGPSDGGITESANTGTSNGRFHGVVTGVARPFREPGIQAPDVPPTGTIPPIPRWDFNPERLRIESATINAQPILTVKSGDVVAPVVGPLDYAFRGYAIYPDGTMGTPVVTPGTLNTTVTDPAGNDITVASFNMFHFFDDADDPDVGDVVLNAGAYADRLNKASIAIRNHLKFPDILGVQEIDNINTLTALAAKINNDALANSQPDPMYTAYLMEGNDIGGIDVGYLVKTAPVPGGAARVVVNSVVQYGLATTWIDPRDGSSDILHDRPSLILDATVNRMTGVSFPIVVVNNHLKSLIGIDDNTVNGATTNGDRNRQKRREQAEDLANYLQTRLTSNPNEHIVLVGDFNAFQFNDGYVDPIGIMSGTPPPNNETVVADDGIDLVNPDFVNLADTPPAAERYSYVHDGNAQTLDHVIVSAGVVTDTSARRIERPRIDADYPETERANAATPFRISDHEPTVGYLTVPALIAADLSMTKTLDTAGPYLAGQTVTYTLTVANAGPDGATNINVTDTPTNLTITNVSGACASLPCTIPSLASGANTAITVTATIVAAGAFDNSATATATENDPNSGDNTDNTLNGGTATVQADVSLTKTLDTAGPYLIGQSVTYTITVSNAGPSTATAINVTDTPTNLTITNVSGACTTFSPCTIASLASGANTTITVTATIVSSGPFSNSATATAAEFDPTTPNSSSAGGTASQINIVEVTKSVSGTFVQGTDVTYTITLTNNMTVTQDDNFQHEFTDVLPAQLTFVSVNATSGTATALISNTFIAWNGSIPSGGTVTITLVCTINPTATGTVSNQGRTHSDTNGDNQNDTEELSDDPATVADDDPTVFTVIPSDGYSATKSASGTFAAGSNVTYSVVLANGFGFMLADNVGDEFTDVLPSSLTLVSASATGGTAVATVGTNTVTWNGSIAASSSVTITIVATISPSASGTVSNQGSTSTDLDNNETNEASGVTDDPSTGATGDPTVFTVVSPASLVTASKTASGTFAPGTNVTYSIVLTNNMGITMLDNPGDELTDILPASLTLVSANATSGTATATIGTNTVTWNGSLAAGASTTITITATIDLNASGTVSNQASFVFDADGNGTNEQSGVSDDPSTGTANDPTIFTVAPASASLSVTKTDSPDPVIAGTNLTYTITVTNSGPSNASAVNLSDTLPAGTTFVSLSAAAGWSCTTPAAGGTGTVSCSIASLGLTTATFTLTVAVDPALIAGSVINNTATATSPTTDPAPGDESGISATTVNASADLSVTKVDTPDPVTAGTNLTYTITVINAGPSHAAGVTLADTLPTGTTFVSLTAPAGWTCTTPAVGGTGAVSCTNASLAAGNAVFTLVVAVDPGLANGTEINNTAVVSSTTTDPNTGNETGSAATTVGVGSADLSITKTDSPDPVNAGGSLAYTITVNNAGPTNASTVSLSDTLPVNTTFVSLASAAGWTCTTPAVGATGSVSCTNPSLGIGSGVFTLTVAVDATTAANTILSNTATVTSATTDPTPGNESATETTAVRSPATLSATKSASGAFEPSSTLTYTIVISNSGPSAQADNPGDEMVDILPAELILVAATATSGTAVANTGTNTVTWNGSIAAGGSVTVTITTTIANFAAPGTTITNQATLSFDSDGNGTNEATAQSDNPATGGADATGFVVSAPASHAAIPTLDERTLLALATLLAAVAILVLKKA